jgi:hypothetical protein
VLEAAEVLYINLALEALEALAEEVLVLSVLVVQEPLTRVAAVEVLIDRAVRTLVVLEVQE